MLVHKDRKETAGTYKITTISNPVSSTYVSQCGGLGALETATHRATDAVRLAWRAHRHCAPGAALDQSQAAPPLAPPTG